MTHLAGIDVFFVYQLHFCFLVWKQPIWISLNPATRKLSAGTYSFYHLSWCLPEKYKNKYKVSFLRHTLKSKILIWITIVFISAAASSVVFCSDQILYKVPARVTNFRCDLHLQLRWWWSWAKQSYLQNSPGVDFCVVLTAPVCWGKTFQKLNKKIRQLTLPSPSPQPGANRTENLKQELIRESALNSQQLRNYQNNKTKNQAFFEFTLLCFDGPD